MAIGFPVWPNASQNKSLQMHFRFSSGFSKKWKAATRCSARPLTTKTCARLHLFCMNSPRNRGWYPARVHPFSSGNGKGDPGHTSKEHRAMHQISFVFSEKHGCVKRKGGHFKGFESCSASNPFGSGLWVRTFIFELHRNPKAIPILNVLEVSLYHPGPELRNCDDCRHGTGTKLHETIQSNTPHDHLLRQILRVGVKHRIAQSKRHG